MKKKLNMFKPYVSKQVFETTQDNLYYVISREISLPLWSKVCSSFQTVIYEKFWPVFHNSALSDGKMNRYTFKGSNPCLTCHFLFGFHLS